MGTSNNYDFSEVLRTEKATKDATEQKKISDNHLRWCLYCESFRAKIRRLLSYVKSARDNENS